MSCASIQPNRETTYKIVSRTQYSQEQGPKGSVSQEASSAVPLLSIRLGCGNDGSNRTTNVRSQRSGKSRQDLRG